MKTNIKLEISGLSLLIMVAVLFVVASHPRGHGDLVGHPLPDFLLKDTNGIVVSKGSLGPGPYNVIIFRTDCPVCKSDLLALAHRRPSSTDNRSILLIAVNSIDKAKSARRDWQLPFRVCGEGIHYAKDNLHLSIVPAIIRVNADGVVVGVHEGRFEGDL